MSFFNKRDEPYVRLNFDAAPAEPNVRDADQRRELLLILLDEEATAARKEKDHVGVSELIEARLAIMHRSGKALPVIPGRSS